MGNNFKSQLYKLLATILLTLLGLLIVWEFWLDKLVVSWIFNEAISKNSFERWEFVITCLFFTGIALIPLLQKTFNVLFELKWAQKALQSNNAREQKLQAIEKSIILTIDKEGKISQINSNGCQIFGKKKKEVIGSNWYSTYFTAKHREQAKSAFSECFLAENIGKNKLKSPLLIDGKEEKIVEWQATQLTDENGNVYALLIYGLDITEQFLLGKKLRSISSQYDSKISAFEVKLKETQEKLDRESAVTLDLKSKHKLSVLLGRTLSALMTTPNQIEQEIHQKINQALKDFGEYSEASTGYISLFVDDNSNMITTHLWEVGQGEASSILKEKTPIESFPWFKKKIMDREIIHCKDINELPPEAVLEKDVYQSQGIHSVINIPLIFNGVSKGYLCFEATNPNLEWDQDDIDTLLLMGDIFSNVIRHPELEAEMDEEIIESREVFEKELEEKNKEFDRIKSELESESSQRKILEKRLQETEDSAEKQTIAAKESLEEKLHELEVEIESRKQIANEIEDSRLTMEAQWKSATDDLEILKNQLNSEAASKISLEEELKKTLSSLSVMQNEFKALKEKYLQEQSIVSGNEKTANQLKEAQTLSDENKKQLAALESENINLQLEINQLKQTENVLEETKSLIANQEDAINALKAEKSDMQSTIDYTRRELDDAGAAMKAEKEKLHELESERSRLNSEIEQLELVRQELIEARDSLEAVEQENKKQNIIRKQLEAEIEDKNEALKGFEKTSSIFNQMDLPVFQINKDLSITNWNKYAENLMGYSADEALGKPLSLLLASTEDKTYINDLFQKVKEHGTHYSDFILGKASGEVINARIYLSELTDDYAESVGAIGYLMDMSEITNKENQVFQIQEQYRALKQNSHFMIVNLTSDFRVLDFNPETQSLLGWERKDVFEKEFFEMVLPEDICNEIREGVSENIKTGYASDFEGPIICKDKTSSIFSWTVIRENEIGDTPSNFLAIGQDITELRQTEHSLKHYEGLLNSIVDNAVDGFITIDENGILQSINSAAERIFGYSSSEIIGQNVNILMPEPYRSQHDNYMNNYLLTGKAKLVGQSPREFLGQRKDGTVFPIEIAIREIQQEFRRVFVGIIHDITKRKQIEQTLKESEEKFRRLLVAETDSILIINATNKRILDANDAAVKLLGYERDELLKLKSDDLTTEPEKSKPSGNGHSLDHPTKPTLQYYKKKDGTVFPAQITTSSFMAKNHKLNFRIIRDTSEQRRLEENLKGSQDYLQTIINNTPEAVYLKDTEGAYILINEKFEGLFNISLKDIKGKTDFDIFPRELADNFQFNEKKVLETGSTVEAQQAILHDDGVHTYHTIKFPLKHSPSNVTYGICGILKDITQNTRLQEELQKYKDQLTDMVDQRTAELKLAQEKLLRSEKLSATGKLAARVSKQINNSIFGIRNILEEINERAALEEIHMGLVNVGVKECNRIADFIKNLQQSHDPEQGALGPVDINNIVEGIIRATQEKEGGRDIIMEKHLSPNIPPVEGVSEQIKQLIQNIVQNAEESLSDEKGRIMIATEKDGSNVKIKIQDTGCGIPPENLVAIFDPFFTTKTAIHRSGLGLLLSLGIAKRHRGDIDVTSKPGSGTTFTISLPIEG